MSLLCLYYSLDYICIYRTAERMLLLLAISSKLYSLSEGLIVAYKQTYKTPSTFEVPHVPDDNV